VIDQQSHPNLDNKRLNFYDPIVLIAHLKWVKAAPLNQDQQLGGVSVMTVITRWDPFREFSTLQDRLNRLFRESYGPEGREESLTTTSFAPAVDVYEDEHNVTLKIEVPGIDEKDIDVRIENNVLTVHGERKFDKEEKEENFRRVERQYGSFTRTFTLPTTVDAEKVAANYDKGILKIALPKKAEAKPKQIKVNVGSEKTLEGKGPSKAA
jgi:HSP20 family protein